MTAALLRSSPRASRAEREHLAGVLEKLRTDDLAMLLIERARGEHHAPDHADVAFERSQQRTVCDPSKPQLTRDSPRYQERAVRAQRHSHRHAEGVGPLG